MRVLCTALLALVLGACASQPSVSENQCRAGDWQTIGYQDGRSGYASTRLLDHQEACGEFQIYPERSAYLDGWHEGVEEFCTPGNGFSLGERGRALPTVCPATSRSGFVAAWEQGNDLYRAQKAVRNAERDVHYIEQRLIDLDREMIAVNAAQLNTDLSAEERVLLVADFRALVEERDQLEADLPIQLAELDRVRQNLALLERSPSFSQASY